MYDSPEELLRKIRLGEDTGLELKAVQLSGNRLVAPKPDNLADVIAGMANTGDGVLVLGVDDKTRDIIGILRSELDAAERALFEICNDKIHPPVSFRTYRMEISDDTGVLQPVLKVEIPRSLFVHKSPHGYFHRQGSSTREMQPDVLARLFQQRSQARLIRFDEQAVPQTSFTDLDDALFERFLGSAVVDPYTTLGKLSILAKDDAGIERATVTGILMCSHAPEKWLPGAFVQAVRYRGVKQDSNYQIDAKEITGPLDSQIRDAVAFVRRNMTVAARKAPGRSEMPQYSIRAVFEAIVNAVAHRDYSIHGSKIRLFMFDDRLEIYSPGALPNTLTVESLPLRQSTRNELVTTLLSKCPVEDPTGQLSRQYLMEKRGDGVPIIIEESLKQSGREPTYTLIDGAELRLVIWASIDAR